MRCIDIVFVKPDKGNGVVVRDRLDYISKLESIVNDKNKFVQLLNDPTSERESRQYNFLYYLKRTGRLTESVFDHIKPSGSKPGRLYGLLKIHKANTPLRPIVSCVGTYTYNLAQFLVELLQPMMKNQYSVKDSFAFANEIKNFPGVPIMSSFDVTGLFTCIPLDETINICLDFLFAETDLVMNLTRIQLRKMFHFALKENHFLLADKIYNQIDGVAMGSSLCPVMAYIYL